MTVHSFHIFDRKGKTLFTKRYVKSMGAAEDEEQLSEQRKLVFGMLFSLRELSNSLSPSEGPGDLKLVKTGAATLYNYETVSGLRFCLYTTPETSYSPSNVHSGSNAHHPSTTPTAKTPTSGSGISGSTSGGAAGIKNSTTMMTSPAVTTNIRKALQHVYEHIWVTFVVRSPMYEPYDPNIASTNFEASLDNYLKGMTWFR